MKECGFAAKDAKAFTDMLATQLMTLDGVSNYQPLITLNILSLIFNTETFVEKFLVKS